TEITPVPGAPDFVLGIINLRGNVVTVINIRNVFNLADGEINEHSRIVIVEAAEQVIGILVDSVDEVVDVKQSEIEKTPNVGNKEMLKCFQGVCNNADELMILVDIHQLVMDKMSGQ